MDIVGIGTDIVECLRIAQMIERHGELLREGHKVVGTTGWR
jgi:phosphopantetheinyl transferase (holo-ACP synthase)